jgi:hypothetical protein
MPQLECVVRLRQLSTGLVGTNQACRQSTKGAVTQSIAFAMYAMFAMHEKNSCLYGQRKGPHKTAYAMFAMLAM